MERAEVKSFAQLTLGIEAQLPDLQVADLVGQRLPRPGNVPVHFDSHLMFGQPRVFQEIIDGLLAAPAHRVDPGVQHEPHRTPHLVVELAEFRVGIGVEAHLVAQTLRVETPTLHECGNAVVLAEFGHVLEFLRDGNLQMVARHSFMECEHLHLPLLVASQVVGVHNEVAGTPRPE